MELVITVSSNELLKDKSDVTEEDLLRNFDQIKRDIDSLLQQHPDIFEKYSLNDEPQKYQYTVEPIFSYQVHASS